MSLNQKPNGDGSHRPVINSRTPKEKKQNKISNFK